MFADDNIICCLLPTKCNLYNQPALVEISTYVFFGLNVVFVIFILITTIYSIRLIWNHYIEAIVTDLVCPNSSIKIDDLTSKDEVHGMMDNCHDTCYYYEQENRIVFDKKSQFNCMNDTELESNTCIVCKENDKNITKVYSKQKRKAYNDMATMCTHNQCSFGSKISIDHFCITTNIQQYDGDPYVSKTSWWSLIKNIYKL